MTFTSADTPINAWLGFELSGQNYVVPLEDVREIIRLESCTPIPGAPSEVLGIINLRGSIITIIDGSRRLGLSPSKNTEDHRLIIFHDEEETIGMRIDVLHDVMNLDTREMLPPPPGRAARNEDPVIGVLPHGDGFLALLDTIKLRRPSAYVSMGF